MKPSTQVLPLIAILSASSNAQNSTTVVNDPTDDGVVTSYYSVCPTTTSTTITLPGTTTICPDGGCDPMYPIITAEPYPITIMGSDGRETIYNIETTILPHLCDGGVCGAAYTISEQCPCTAGPKTVTINSCPAGFTVTEVECTVCAANGGPSTVTITTPISNGPYASQTPSMGPAFNSPAQITNAAAAAAARSGSSAGSNNVATPGAANTASPAGPAPTMAAPAAGNSPVAATSNVGGAAAPSGNSMTGTNRTAPISPAITPYTGAADSLSVGISLAFAGVLGAMALLL